ncbi:Mitochondrial RNA-splicing protein MRS4 [Wickerhamomyces ciferrii]|uniref:Mitochondrial RNA-splicing protein MRS4 n=1 Tax=Wickerhamomyces ciferrii (strain ATCC 14091 / BCRC 22168 / CBS 111 / JCM 3599 / NBRC 0793 / NRRL Y-1031 F-60-10) TaxID=1206466 RepID=K0KCY3_WICCF|nr:Mitochondrial RNA-splicing protein MRS4 [Wickerhamomyces ciferrii]CCH42965.1 Mitochondrial RNA-splicing protein MRS4 [Wickerhamomyces ciferrii]
MPAEQQKFILDTPSSPSKSSSHIEPIITPEEIDYESLPEGTTLTSQCIAGAFAGILEHTVMYPVDAIKTRMQVMNSQGKSNLSGRVISSLYKISSTEGWTSLWRGTSSVILGAGPAHAVYFGTYEYVKKQLIHEDDNSHQPLRVAIAGSAATVVSEALMNPFDVIKQRMQLHTGLQKLGLGGTIAKVYQKEGIKAFYYSYPTTITMTIPFTALNFVVYESSAKILNPNGEHDPLKHCIAGGLAGGVASALTTPLDCIKTLLQTKGEFQDVRIQNTNSLYGGAKIIYQLDGFKGFWKGIKPRIISNVPSTAICWTAYEMAKYYLTRNQSTSSPLS